MKKILLIFACAILGRGLLAQDINGLYPGERYTEAEVNTAMRAQGPVSVSASLRYRDETDRIYRGAVLSFKGDLLVAWTLVSPRYGAFKAYKPGGLRVGQGINSLNRVQDAFPRKIPGTYYWSLFDYQEVFEVIVEVKNTKITIINCRLNGAADGSIGKEELTGALRIPDPKLY